MEDIADEMQPGNLARHRCAVNQKRGHNYVRDLHQNKVEKVRLVILRRHECEGYGERTSDAASACSKLNAMQRASSPRRPLSARNIASNRRLASLPSLFFRPCSRSDSSAESVE